MGGKNLNNSDVILAKKPEYLKHQHGTRQSENYLDLFCQAVSVITIEKSILTSGRSVSDGPCLGTSCESYL